MGKDYSSSMDYPLGQRLRELPGPLLLTGHTGFKGTWMTLLLEHLKVSVVGFSLPPEKYSLYDRAELTGAIPEVFADVRDYEALEQFIALHKPSTIVHMAAQPLVLKSYENPRETFDVNVMGTVNLLDVAFKKDFVKAIIVVTTDKVYKNDNSGQSFVESDPLEGKDPYSASKVGTEAVVAAWQQISRVSKGPIVMSVRAGNVIGGGDFAENRIIPDLIRGIVNGNPVEIRNPNSTRPWQHVLDPLSGYLLALESILAGRDISSLNFGPNDENWPVKLLIDKSRNHLEGKGIQLEIKVDSSGPNNIESTALNLNSSSAHLQLNWKPLWDQEKSIFKSIDWWCNLILKKESARLLTMNDIKEYLGEE
jgi:CDP-glucose 4,6-dehydratase